MLRRNLASEFVAGAYVFPGGSVDPEDHGPGVEALCRGRTDAEASAVLGVESGGLAYWVAALRECFEEAGVLLARHRSHGAGRTGRCSTRPTPRWPLRFAAYRDAVNERRTRPPRYLPAGGPGAGGRRRALRQPLDHPGAGPATLRHPLLHHRRARPARWPATTTTETIATIWVRPHDALAREAAGEIELLPPTIANLRSIEGFTSTGEVMAWASQVTHVTTVLPIVLIEDGHILILRPGDQGYEEALADRLASGAQIDPAPGRHWPGRPGVPRPEPPEADRRAPAVTGQPSAVGGHSAAAATAASTRSSRRTLQPSMDTTGATVVMTDSAMASNTSASGLPSSRATGVPASPPGRHRGVQGDLTDQRDPDVGGQAGTTS